MQPHFYEDPLESAFHVAYLILIVLVLGQFQSHTSILKWGASFRWSFRPNSAWGSIETMPIGTRPTLFFCHQRPISQLKLSFRVFDRPFSLRLDFVKTFFIKTLKS